MNDIPRRIRIDLQTPIEAAIRAARDAVEGGGAHPHMTRATVLLGQALDAVADFVDGVPIHPAPADDARARVDEDGCCVGCGRSVQPSPCCPDYPADGASGAEAMREACAKACRDRSRSLYDGKQMVAGLEASKCADMIDALPLPARADAVEEAARGREAVALLADARKCVEFVNSKSSLASLGYYDTWLARCDRLLAAERDAALRREKRGDRG